MPSGYMLDTTVFNHVLRGQLKPSALATRGPLFVTHVQHDEIRATKDATKRAQLLSVFRVVEAAQVATASAARDYSRFDRAGWSPDNRRFDRRFDSMLAALDGRNRSKPNNPRDILIAETARRRGLGLVTNDDDLAEVVRTFGGVALALQQFVLST
jgi:predicted nucleic acid-binding protein